MIELSSGAGPVRSTRLAIALPVYEANNMTKKVLTRTFPKKSSFFNGVFLQPC
jgi:hypothetical protein